MNSATLDTYVCGLCGKEQVSDHGPCICPHCSHFGPERDFPTRKTLTLRQQNDSFRAGLIVGGCAFPGTVVVTADVRAMGRDFLTDATLAVAFDGDFGVENDPWGDHAFGVVTVGDERLYWKIDYYDTDLEFGSNNPSDPAMTHRVLTILFPSEY